ncbi:hypothetical protein BCH308197_5141 [Bacillus cereus H3081.97]|uniref:Uncharacterized protein n=1 Tax=Bacillus cereus (strain AH187) TaxID=405534 RepID=B7HW42_BACC7|nr:hypothetical protein BCAH187_A5272 [Bacillus cereus AH187]EDZ56515.1 hypothetical protein BCH308197_5141 [Bacillus cereus H3081.97]EEK97907.1 hypothetical protein bcere0013_49350 [Bacillus cereus BDRD-ST26]KLA04458.1 hypothetical protein B4086_5039 [Bacillus cereus]KLA05545.1 hypothetical protein B4153_5328 [Bacillus cereus]
MASSMNLFIKNIRDETLLTGIPSVFSEKSTLRKNFTT